MSRKKNSAAEQLANAKGQKNLDKAKCSSKVVLDDIIDRDALERRKLLQTSKTKTKVETKVQTPKEKQWWEKEISPKEFCIREYQGKYYARLDVWGKDVWIGAYKSKGEVEDVINNYCIQTTKKNPSDRKFVNLHSVIISIP